MAKKELMRWEGKPYFRWNKMHNGTRFKVTAEELGFTGDDRTKENTLDSANDWWQKQLTTLAPKKRKKTPNPFDDLYPPDEFGEVNILPGNFPSQLQDIKTRLKTDPKFLSKLNRVVAPEKTLNVKTWCEKYLESKRLTWNKSPGRYDNLQRSIRRFQNTIGESEPITAINWQGWDNFVIDLHKSGLGESTIRDNVSDSREFVRWLVRRQIIPPVENITETKIKVSAKAIQHFTPKEIQSMLEKSDGLLRAFLLLFCNCGFRQSDVATIQCSMMDGKYITRQRAKTEGTNAPTVSWLLWEETKEAIKPFANSKGLLFTRENGLPWVVEGLNEQHTRSRDDVFRRELWVPFNEEHDWRLSCDKIRASCANLLKTDSYNTNQLSIQIKYLGQSPSGVAMRHYIDPPQKEFDKAIRNLGKSLKLKV